MAPRSIGVAIAKQLRAAANSSNRHHTDKRDKQALGSAHSHIILLENDTHGSQMPCSIAIIAR
jgi:hypothetical protein